MVSNESSKSWNNCNTVSSGARNAAARRCGVGKARQTASKKSINHTKKFRDGTSKRRANCNTISRWMRNEIHRRCGVDYRDRIRLLATPHLRGAAFLAPLDAVLQLFQLFELSSLTSSALKSLAAMLWPFGTLVKKTAANFSGVSAPRQESPCDSCVLYLLHLFSFSLKLCV